MPSLLAQERGLKRVSGSGFTVGQKSLLAQERGLKHKMPGTFPSLSVVAPRAGAWIETNEAYIEELNNPRSLLAQERGLKPRISSVSMSFIVVAPRAGAWIETCYRCPWCP